MADLTKVRHFVVRPDGSGVLTIETFGMPAYPGFSPNSQGIREVALSAEDVATIRAVLAPPVLPAPSLPKPPASPAEPTHEDPHGI